MVGQAWLVVGQGEPTLLAIREVVNSDRGFVATLDGWALASVLMHATWLDWRRQSDDEEDHTWALLVPRSVDETSLAADKTILSYRLVFDVPETINVCRRANPEDEVSVRMALRELARRTLVGEEQISEGELLAIGVRALLPRLTVPQILRFFRVAREQATEDKIREILRP